MKILYGVQATGNGHLSRARAMNKHFVNTNARVDYLFSGRSRDKLFDMEPFGDFRVLDGLTFSSGNGRINYLKTLFTNNPVKFVRDVWQLDVADYDVILNDFEPVTAWAGKLRNKTVINIGHQQAFDYPVPSRGSNPASRMVMKFFAPGNVRLGLHWHHFNCPLLPPIIDIDESDLPVAHNKILVYLPFEDPDRVYETLRPFKEFEFFIYSPLHNQTLDDGHLHLRKVALHGFKRDLHSSIGVICNAGFETPSECLQLGKRVLVKPVHKQMEQESNAAALQQLALGDVMGQLDGNVISRWLEGAAGLRKVSYPDVAGAIVGWLLAGDWSYPALQRLSDDLWNRTTFSNGATYSFSGLS